MVKTHMQRLLWSILGWVITAPVHLSALAEDAADAGGVEVPPPQQFFMFACWPGMPCMNWVQLIENLTNAFFIWGNFLALATFMIGAFFIVLSAGKDTMVQNGKSMMIGSLIGLAILYGTVGLYRTVVYLVYSG